MQGVTLEVKYAVGVFVDIEGALGSAPFHAANEYVGDNTLSEWINARLT